MANTFKFGNGQWAVGKETALAYNDENSNFKPLPFTFDRASTATVVNKNGLIETVGVDEPRIDFLNNTKGHLLLEPIRSNKITYSEGFNNWASVFTAVSLNEVVSPDGSVNATKLTDTSDSSTHRIQLGNTTSSSGSFCYSIFLKKGTLTTVALSVYSGANAADSKFDLDNGTIVSTTNGTAEIQEYGNDWYRCVVKGTLASTSTTVYIYLKEKASYSGSGQFLYAWGGQLEDGSYATSYIPTSGQSGGVTRSADYTKILNSPILKATNQFTLFFDAKDFLLVNGTSTSFDDVMFVLGAGESPYDAGTSIHIYNRTWFYYNGSTADNIGVCYNALTDSKFAISYDGTKYTRYANGVKLGTFTVTASMANWDSITTAASADGQGDDRVFNLANLELYNTALTDAQLISKTSI